MTSFTLIRVSLLGAILASLTFSPVATRSRVETPGAPDSLASTSTFYSFRRDLRRCASPRCGGYFIKLVNQARMRCADNRYQSECYVASIDWGGNNEPDNDRALLRGKMSSRGDRNGKFGVLRVSEVWRPGSDKQPTGMFYRVRDRGVRCIAAPCATHHEATLNSTASRNVAGVDLAGAGAADNAVSEATSGMTDADGILVSGVHESVTGPAGRSQMLKATQFYLRTSGPTAQKPCMKTGCSQQICSDKEVFTTCEYKTEYACYKKAACERQASGECGFTQTPELEACLKRGSKG
jgi:uncharacterized protein DUF6748